MRLSAQIAPAPVAATGDCVQLDHLRADSGRIFGIALSNLSAADIGRIIARTSVSPNEEAKLVVTANVDHIVRLQSDGVFQEAYAAARVVTTDGTPVFLYARAKRCSVPEKVTGHDLLREVLGSARRDQRFFYILDSYETANGVSRAMQERGWRPANIETRVPPLGFERNDTFCKALANEIRAFQPHVIVLGVGAPRSEKFVHTNRTSLGGAWCLCVGDAVKVLGGTGIRAPVQFQKLGVEWIWRLFREPRRLWRRYLWDSRTFLSAVIADCRSRPVR